MKFKPEIFAYVLILLCIVLVLLYADSLFVARLNSVSNVLLSALTAGYVFLTYWILRSTRQSTLEQTRPYVVVTLPLDRQEVLLSIRNVGYRPAFDVQVIITPSLATLGNEESMWKPLLYQAFMPANHEVHNPVGIAIAILKLKPEQKVFDVQLNYFDADRNHYSPKPYKLDLNSYIFEKLVVETTYMKK